MEKKLVKQLPMCNGNTNHNEFHEDDVNGSETLEETSVSNTLIFYVNGKEVQFIFIRCCNIIYLAI